MLSSNDLVHYLLEQNLITFDSVVDGDLTIAATRSRNHNFRVIRRGSTNFFVKRALPTDEQTRLTLHREAVWYQTVNNAEVFSKLREYLPIYYGYDPDYPLLVIELIPNGISLREYHNLVRSFPVKIGQLIGQALAACHSISEHTVSAQAQDLFQFHLPWILTVDLHSRPFHNALSPANLELLTIVRQDPEFDKLLTDLRNRWHRTALVHGDMKWDNCIVYPIAENDPPTSFKVVDWETFGLGDPGWDIGAIFHAYLAYWVWSMPVIENSTITQLIDNARFPIETMQPALQAFWQTYREELQLSESQANDLLIQSVMFSGARLLQTTYESMYQSVRLTAHAIYMVQLGQNLLSSPEEAIEILLCIS